jgi:hypothetical protein
MPATLIDCESEYLEPSVCSSGRQHTRLAITLAVTAALIAPVSGHDRDWPREKTDGYRHHHPAPGVRYYRSPEVIVERERSEEERSRCLEPVRGLGTQWVGTEGALAAARKDWMERVRYDHGESFVDMSHAVDVESRCGRVSIGKILGRVTYRCEIVGRPCKARFEQGEATRTASVAPPPAPAPPSTATPPATRPPLAVLRLFKLSLGRHHDRPVPEQPADKRQPSAHLAALFMGHIVMGALGTMESAPVSAIAFAHKLLNAAFEFPILYRALSISTSSSD